MLQLCKVLSPKTLIDWMQASTHKNWTLLLLLVPIWKVNNAHAAKPVTQITVLQMAPDRPRFIPTMLIVVHL